MVTNNDIGSHAFRLIGMLSLLPEKNTSFCGYQGVFDTKCATQGTSSLVSRESSILVDLDPSVIWNVIRSIYSRKCRSRVQFSKLCPSTLMDSYFGKVPWICQAPMDMDRSSSRAFPNMASVQPGQMMQHRPRITVFLVQNGSTLQLEFSNLIDGNPGVSSKSWLHCS